MDEELRQRRNQGLYRVRRQLQSGQGASIQLDGRTYRNFSSNDYLDLATDPRLTAAAAKTGRRYGCGAGASPLVSGLLPPLRALERTLARWEGSQASLVFTSGYLANLAVLTALAGPEDAVFSDEWNHASLIDGCRLARARVCVYRHGDGNHLADLLRVEETRDRPARRRLIVTDSVFSMDGDLADLATLLDLACRHDALLVVDEAHATGVLGEHGRGVTDLLPADTPGLDRLIKVGTLSKALGAQGGFVCGSRRLIDYLVNHARPYIFSTALAPPSAAAARRAVVLVKSEPDRRRRVLALAALLVKRLKEIGCKVGPTRCQIVPILIGAEKEAVTVSKRLQEQGMLVPAIRPPSVPPGTARLRIGLTAGHKEDDVAALVDAMLGLQSLVTNG
jgi:8-amino-7-oxononanoate synthase